MPGDAGWGRRLRFLTSRDDLATAEGGSLAPRANVLLPGVYAWGSTVASPVTAAGTSWGARSAAALALAALIAGPWLATLRPRIGRSLGIYAFTGLCLLTWLQLGDALLVEGLEPVQAAFGAVGWALFAFGWGAVRKPGAVPEDDPRAEQGEPLQPRQTLPAGGAWILFLSVLGALGPLFLAWEVTRPRHALLAHGAALAAAIALVTSASTIAIQRGATRRLAAPSRRLSSASGPLTALAALAVAGLIWLLLR